MKNKIPIYLCSTISNQCKEIEENNRMGKTRDLFKKIRDIKGTFHVKMAAQRFVWAARQPLRNAALGALFA